MELLTYRHAWGAVGRGARFDRFSSFVPAVKEAGYQGIELAPVVFDAMPEAYGAEGAAILRELLVEHQLELVPMIMTFGDTVEAHLHQFQLQLEQAQTWQPRLIVSHTGSDAMSDSEATRLLRACEKESQQIDLRIVHETHRGRALSTPWRTASVLGAVPNLWLKADFSHFVCSAERLLEDAEDLMAQLCGRVLHADHRIGHENGPQVPDPRSRRWQRQAAAFQQWWDQIWRAAEGRGEGWVSITPEYGPVSYAPADITADGLWELCDWAAEASRERFASGAWRVGADTAA